MRGDGAHVGSDETQTIVNDVDAAATDPFFWNMFRCAWMNFNDNIIFKTHPQLGLHIIVMHAYVLASTNT